MAERNNDKLYKLVVTAFFAAIVVVLQVTLGLITVGEINLNFVLIPILLAAALYGKMAGTIAGGAFGITVFIQCITGTQVFGAMLLSINWFYTFVACVGRGLLVGFLAAVIYQASAKAVKSRYLRALIASVAAPIINTGIFLLCYALMFNENMRGFMLSEGAGAMYILFIFLTGINFVFEFASTVIIAPPVAVVLEKAKNQLAKNG
ncbi:MAG: ECF transporter S component [Eubacteriales bacterium]